MAQHADVVIIGGGVIGLTAAYFLTRSGASVEIYDRRELGKEASWAGAGIIPPGNAARAASAIDRLRAWGSERFAAFTRDLTARTGIDTGFSHCGGIEFLDETDSDVRDLWRAEGIAYRQVDRAKLKAMEPNLAPPQNEGSYLPDMAQVRNPWHLRALIEACRRCGVQMYPNLAGARWQLSNGKITGIKLDNGTIRTAGSYLLTVGAWGADWLQPLGIQIPIHPVRGQIRLYNPPDPLLNKIVIDGKRYLVPRGDGRILVGSTEEPEAGFDSATTHQGQWDLHDFASNLIPQLKKLNAEYTWAGLRPGSVDGMPYLCNLDDHYNVFVAFGHFRAGMQLSLGTARVMTDWILGRPSIVPTTAFRLDRTPNPHRPVVFRS